MLSSKWLKTFIHSLLLCRARNVPFSITMAISHPSRLQHLINYVLNKWNKSKKPHTFHIDIRKWNDSNFTVYGAWEVLTNDWSLTGFFFFLFSIETLFNTIIVFRMKNLFDSKPLTTKQTSNPHISITHSLQYNCHRGSQNKFRITWFKLLYVCIKKRSRCLYRMCKYSWNSSETFAFVKYQSKLRISLAS